MSSFVYWTVTYMTGLFCTVGLTAVMPVQAERLLVLAGTAVLTCMYIYILFIIRRKGHERQFEG